MSLLSPGEITTDLTQLRNFFSDFTGNPFCFTKSDLIIAHHNKPLTFTMSSFGYKTARIYFLQIAVGFKKQSERSWVVVVVCSIHIVEDV